LTPGAAFAPGFEFEVNEVELSIASRDLLLYTNSRGLVQTGGLPHLYCSQSRRKTQMSRGIAVGLALMFIFTASCKGSETIDPKTASHPETADLNEAISIAVARLADVQKSSGEYKLVSAQQVVVEGKYVWRITFKPVKLLPDDPSSQIIGAGGEIFMNVDLKTKEAAVTYGE
jgi:hypothetical protein